MKKSPAFWALLAFMAVAAPVSAQTLAEKLMPLPGVVAVGEFGLDGQMKNYKGTLSTEAANMLARLCAVTTHLGIIQEPGLSKVPELKLSPVNHWYVLSAGEHSICVVARRVIVVKSNEADFDKIFSILRTEQ
ncbi:MAG: DUF2173 family protein [Pseudomonadota bacterium]